MAKELPIWLMLMCGLAFSGKSTLSRKLAIAFDLHLVDYDELLVRLGFDQEKMTSQNWKTLHQLASHDARESIERGRNVIVDDTFSRRFLRDRFRVVATECGANFLIVNMIIEPGLLRRRVQMNETKQTRRHVPWESIEHDIAEFEHPTSAEPTLKIHEGYEFNTVVQNLRNIMMPAG